MKLSIHPSSICLSRLPLDNAESPGMHVQLLALEDPKAAAVLIDSRTLLSHYFQWKQGIGPKSTDHSSYECKFFS